MFILASSQKVSVEPYYFPLSTFMTFFFNITIISSFFNSIQIIIVIIIIIIIRFNLFLVLDK